MKGYNIAYTAGGNPQFVFARKLTFSKDECLELKDNEMVEEIASALRKLGTVEMIGSAKSLTGTKRLAQAKHDWDFVFNFCEGYGTIGREAQVSAMLEAHRTPFTFSDSATTGFALDLYNAIYMF